MWHPALADSNSAAAASVAAGNVVPLAALEPLAAAKLGSDGGGSGGGGGGGGGVASLWLRRSCHDFQRLARRTIYQPNAFAPAAAPDAAPFVGVGVAARRVPDTDLFLVLVDGVSFAVPAAPPVCSRAACLRDEPNDHCACEAPLGLPFYEQCAHEVADGERGGVLACPVAYELLRPIEPQLASLPPCDDDNNNNNGNFGNNGGNGNGGEFDYSDNDDGFVRYDRDQHSPASGSAGIDGFTVALIVAAIIAVLAVCGAGAAFMAMQRNKASQLYEADKIKTPSRGQTPPNGVVMMQRRSRESSLRGSRQSRWDLASPPSPDCPEKDQDHCPDRDQSHIQLNQAHHRFEFFFFFFFFLA